MHKDINVNVSGPVQPASTYKTVVLKGNHSFVSQVTEPNTKYVIKHNFDLGGESITIPEGCLLEFDGGSISNGTIVGQSTILIYNQELDTIFHTVTRQGTFVYNNTVSADEEDITEVGNILKLKDRGTADGMGKIILRKNKTFAEQLTQENTIYVIQYDFDLGGSSVTIPANCVLEFDGGSLSNGAIAGDFIIDSERKGIFENVDLSGYAGPTIKYSYIKNASVYVGQIDFDNLPKYVDFENKNLIANEVINIGNKEFHYKNLVLTTAYGFRKWDTIIAQGNCATVAETSNFYTNCIVTDSELPEAYVGKIIKIKTASAVDTDNRPDDSGVPTLYKGITAIITKIDGTNVYFSGFITKFNASETYEGTVVNSTYTISDAIPFSLDCCNFIFSTNTGASFGGYNYRITNSSFRALVGSDALVSLGGYKGIIDNCSVIGAYYEGSSTSYGIQTNGASQIIIKNSYFEGNRRSVDFSGSFESRYCEVCDCIISQNTNIEVGSALGGHSTSFGNIYRRNKIYGYYQMGIQCRGENETIEENEFYCRCAGAIISAALNTSIIRNKVNYGLRNQSGTFVRCFPQLKTTSITIKNNEVYVSSRFFYSDITGNIIVCDNIINFIPNSSVGASYLVSGGSYSGIYINNIINDTAGTYHFFPEGSTIYLNSLIINGLQIPLKFTKLNGDDLSENEAAKITITSAILFVDKLSKSNIGSDNGIIKLTLSFSISSTLSGSVAIGGKDNPIIYSASSTSLLKGLLVPLSLTYCKFPSGTCIVRLGKDSIHIGKDTYSGHLDAGDYMIEAYL